MAQTEQRHVGNVVMSLQLFGTVARGKCSHVVTAFWTDYASGVARPFSVLFGMGPGIFFQEEVLDETECSH